jgi:hypothetical protein
LSTLDHPIDIILKDGNTTREWYISTQYITANYITIIGNPDRLDTVWYGGGDNITNHIN